MKWVLVGMIMVCNACADLMSTAGMRQYGMVDNLRPSGVARLVHALSRNGYVVGGVVANAIGFFTLMSLLSLAGVSFAVPATAGSFVLETGPPNSCSKKVCVAEAAGERPLSPAVLLF